MVGDPCSTYALWIIISQSIHVYKPCNYHQPYIHICMSFSELTVVLFILLHFNEIPSYDIVIAVS